MWAQETSPAWIPTELSLKSPNLLVFCSLLVQGREAAAQKVMAAHVGERDLPLGEGQLRSGMLRHPVHAVLLQESSWLLLALKHHQHWLHRQHLQPPPARYSVCWGWKHLVKEDKH